jgi:regulator of RNase E activity RraA
MQGRIIDYIRRNRVSTTEVADCMNKTGAIPRVQAINRGHFRVGNVFWAFAYAETNWHVHEQIQTVQEGDIVLVEAFECNDRAIFGDLVSKYLLLYKQAAAIVVAGKMRDAHTLLKENWSIWCEGFTPVGCFNRQMDVKLDPKLLAEHREKYHGGVAVCDDAGVVVVPKEMLNDDFLKELENIEAQEDIWYECIDRLKWSTFDTVCLKKYIHTKRETP